jgi:dTDP-4-dehydrorhamnose reductase
MRILITGGEGQLGRALAAASNPDVVMEAMGRERLDVSDFGPALSWIGRLGIDLVVHAAALTDTARCEREPDLAMAVNANGAGNVYEATSLTGAQLVCVSTNEVFDGTKGAPYDEDDDPHAINAYGRSKVSGERSIDPSSHGGVCGGPGGRGPMLLRKAPAIVRTSWLYGDGDANFVAKVLAAARAGRRLRFVTDEIASPTSADDLAAAIVALIERGAPGGIYHLTNEGEASRYEWACEILRLAGVDAPVDGITTAELRAAGYDGPQKPAYSVLANNNARALGITMRPWRVALAAHFERHPELRIHSTSAEPRTER